jgi:2,3-bisphosphoglycerate-dependent phosphoglycerate mutase
MQYYLCFLLKLEVSYNNCYFKSIKNGESKEDVLNRTLPYFENDIIYTLSENKFPLIVTHKHTARVLMKYLLKLNDEDFEEYQFPNKKILLLNFDNEYEFVNYEEIKY